MKVLIVHLSDIHFKQENNVISERITQIRQAVQGSAIDYDACLIAMSGDVAWSGGIAEYDVADRFFSELKDQLSAARPQAPVWETFIPGNHDCALPKQAKARQALTQAVLQDPPHTADADLSIVHDCLKVQENFFTFAGTREISQEVVDFSDPDNRLAYRSVFRHGGKSLCVVCYNTAWMSILHEQPQHLLAPIWIAPEGLLGDDRFDAQIVMFHHPYGWLQVPNYRQFKAMVERNADVVLTGHEHVADHAKKRTIRGETLDYLEGAVLQESGAPDDSGFNLVVLDLSQNEYQVTLFKWTPAGQRYATTDQSPWMQFERTRRSNGAKTLEPTSDFERYLADPGLPLLHPRRPNPTLSDFFVYPDFNSHYLAKGRSAGLLDNLKPVRGKEILANLLRDKKIVVMGPEKSGKTALAKKLCADLLSERKVPLILGGSELSKPDEKTLRKVIDATVAKAYGADKTELFWQLDKEEKIVLVDDLHLCKLNRNGINEVVRLLADAFDSVLLLVDDLFAIEDMTRQSTESLPLLDFYQCSILPFGYRLRGQLIERWVRLGQEYEADEQVIAHTIRVLESRMSSLMGKNVLPHQPIFVLTILQSEEANTSNQDHNLGALGYHFQMLVNMAFAEARQRVKQAPPADAIDTCAARLAWKLFTDEARYVGSDEAERTILDYKDESKTPYSIAKLLETLEAAKILRSNGEGRKFFPYKHLYYYFVARYLWANLNSLSGRDEVRRTIRTMIQKIHVDDYANILTLFVYFTRDEESIRGILESARSIYADEDLFDFTEDTSYLKELAKKKPLPLPVAKRIQDNQDEHRTIMDEVENAEEDDFNPGESDEDEQDFKELLRLNTALKTLEIMGQVLRNFPGALPGALKVEIAEESYRLGMRTLHVIHRNMGERLELLRAVFREMFRELRQIEDRETLQRLTDNWLFMIAYSSSYGMLKRISYCIGSEDLVPVYKEVLSKRGILAYNLIDLSLKLDNIRGFPDEEVERIKRMVEKKQFAKLVFQNLVRNHFYLFPHPLAKIESVCAKLDIPIEYAKMLNPSDKRLLPAAKPKSG